MGKLYYMASVPFLQAYPLLFSISTVVQYSTVLHSVSARAWPVYLVLLLIPPSKRSWYSRLQKFQQECKNVCFYETLMIYLATLHNKSKILYKIHIILFYYLFPSLPICSYLLVCYNVACDPVLRICPMQYAASVESRYITSLLFGLTFLSRICHIGRKYRQTKDIFVPTCHVALDCRSKTILRYMHLQKYIYFSFGNVPI